MTVQERIMTIRLSERIGRNPEYARRIGLDVGRERRPIHTKDIREKALG